MLEERTCQVSQVQQSLTRNAIMIQDEE